MVESPSGVPDLYEIILALDDFEDGGDVAAAVPCLDFDPPAFEIRREGAGVAPPVRAPGVVGKEARSESGDRFSRREFGRLGRVRSSRSWRTSSSCNLAAGPVPFEALSYRGPDPCADVGLMLCPEPIQGGVQVRSEADAERFHPLTLAWPTNSPTVPIVLQISAGGGVGRRGAGVSDFARCVYATHKLLDSGELPSPWTPRPGGGPPPWPARD